MGLLFSGVQPEDLDEENFIDNAQFQFELNAGKRFFYTNQQPPNNCMAKQHHLDIIGIGVSFSV